MAMINTNIYIINETNAIIQELQQQAHTFALTENNKSPQNDTDHTLW